MKLSLLALSLFFGILANGQIDTLPQKTILEKNIKSQTVVCLVSTARDSSKQDTANVTIIAYNRSGYPTDAGYRAVFDKSRYSSKSQFSYDPAGQLNRIITTEKEDSASIDSIIWSSPTKYTRYRQHYPPVIHEFIGDSIDLEIVGRDTSVHLRHREKPLATDHWWQEYPRSYARREVKEDPQHRIDTAVFYNNSGKIQMTIVDHYDEQGRVVETDYFNREDNSFVFYTARYNSKYNMIYGIPTGKKPYRTLRAYNEKGLLIQEKWVCPTKRNPLVVINYSYEYY